MNIFLLQVKWVTFGEILHCFETWFIKWMHFPIYPGYNSCGFYYPLLLELPPLDCGLHNRLIHL